MIHIVDTHALWWYLELDPRLSARARAVLSSREPDSGIVVPSIVLAEIWHLCQRERITTSPQDIRTRVLSSVNCSIHPLDEGILDLLPAGLDIHDAMIVATALFYRDVLREQTQLITRDRAITESRLVDVLW